LILFVIRPQNLFDPLEIVNYLRELQLKPNPYLELH